MALPDHGSIGEALKRLLVVRGNRPLSAQQAYKLLAEQLKVSRADLSLVIKSDDGSENAWQNRCRSARNNLVKSGVLNQNPYDTWYLTDAAFRGLTSTAEELGL
jgi:hypothetical protein